MTFTFAVLEQTRRNLLTSIEGLNHSQLNNIPKGFNNSIIWNLGHIIVSEQLLCYTFSGLEGNLSQDKIESFRRGTKPESDIDSSLINAIIEQIKSSVSVLKSDYENGVFKSYQPYKTSYGIELQSIEKAIKFNIAHEALHLGYIMAMRHLV